MPLGHPCLTSTPVLVTALPAAAEPVFNRIATFATPQNVTAGEDASHETSAEIISASEDGMTLV